MALPWDEPNVRRPLPFSIRTDRKTAADYTFYCQRQFDGHGEPAPTRRLFVSEELAGLGVGFVVTDVLALVLLLEHRAKQM